jgi:hypothetical protein
VAPIVVPSVIVEAWSSAVANAEAAMLKELEADTLEDASIQTWRNLQGRQVWRRSA